MPKRPEFEPYHLIWLEQHPNRTKEWLKAMMRDGFHIHHIDGNHDNNEDTNLVLIEGCDHFMIHNGSKRPLKLVPQRTKEGEMPSVVKRRGTKKMQSALHNPIGQSRSDARIALLTQAVALAAKAA